MLITSDSFSAVRKVAKLIPPIKGDRHNLDYMAGPLFLMFKDLLDGNLEAETSNFPNLVLQLRITMAPTKSSRLMPIDSPTNTFTDVEYISVSRINKVVHVVQHIYRARCASCIDQ